MNQAPTSTDSVSGFLTRRIIGFFMFALVALVFLQVNVYGQEAVNEKSFLLLPYHPDFYLSDAERDISRQSGRDPDEFRTYFRQTLDRNLHEELDKAGRCVSLLQDTTLRSIKILENFYNQTAYNYHEPVGKRADVLTGKSEKRKREKAYDDLHTAPHSFATRGDARYLRAEVKDTSLLPGLAGRFGADYIISINQLEIKTNYNTCIDIANKIYRREVIVHYSVFDSRGREVAGNFEFSFFPSDSNKDTAIAERCFPEIASAIAKHLSGILEKSRN